MGFQSSRRKHSKEKKLKLGKGKGGAAQRYYQPPSIKTKIDMTDLELKIKRDKRAAAKPWARLPRLAT